MVDLEKNQKNKAKVQLTRIGRFRLQSDIQFFTYGCKGFILVFLSIFSTIACSRVAGNVVTATQPIGDLKTIETEPIIRRTSSPIEPIEPKFIDPIKLAWFYKPPTNNDLGHLAANYQLFILTKLDEEVRDQLIQHHGVTEPVLRYVRFDAIMDPGSCLDQPYRNQVADEIGDFCRISAQHPDWFLLDEEGQRIRNDDGDFYLMDPGNQGWREFWLQRVLKNQAALGWEGLFLDNVEAGFSKRNRSNRLPARYESEEEYQLAIRDFLKMIYEKYSHPTQSPLFANVLSEDVPDGLLSYLPYLDGVMLEGFAVDWHSGYRTTEEWENQLEVIETVLQTNTHVLMVAKGDEVDDDRQRFAFASYLLVTNGNSSFRYVLTDRTDEEIYFDNYDYDLGQPLGLRIWDDGYWIRNFQNGVVRVDSEKHEAEIWSQYQ